MSVHIHDDQSVSRTILPRLDSTGHCPSRRRPETIASRFARTGQTRRDEVMLRGASPKLLAAAAAATVICTGGVVVAASSAAQAAPAPATAVHATTGKLSTTAAPG